MLQAIQIIKKWDTQYLVSILLVLSLLAIPMSSTAKSICIVGAAILIIISPSYSAALGRVFKQFWCKAIIGLFLFVLMACFWSEAHLNQKFLVIEKYSKLLYLPILAVGFKDEKTRKFAIYTYLLAMFITCLLSILKSLDLLHYHTTDPGQVFRNHIMTSFMMSLAAYLSAILLLKQKGWGARIAYLSLVLLFSYQLFFINTGRTGYVIYAVLLALYIVQVLSLRQAILAAVLCCIGLTVVYQHSITLQNGVHSTIEQWNDYHHNNKDTSVGYRLQFHHYAKKLYDRHPIIGNGTGSFTYLYAQEKPVPGWSRKLLEPHSQYWLVASELGTVGLLLWGMIFISLIIASWQLKTMRAIALAVLIPFIIGNSTDSLLFYSGTGYLFILFMALCLGEQLPNGNRRSTVL